MVVIDKVKEKLDTLCRNNIKASSNS